jgi:hypothetical protein
MVTTTELRSQWRLVENGGLKPRTEREGIWRASCDKEHERVLWKAREDSPGHIRQE